MGSAGLAAPPPLLWMAPALSGGGYSSEALTFALGLAPRLGRRFSLRQFAEQADTHFASGLPPHLSALLSRALELPGDRGFDTRLRRRGVVVCHATPDAWVPSAFAGWDAIAPCPPAHAPFAVGRTMFETDALPAAWVARCNRMDEIWVPTDFHREVFAAAGVRADKLVVIGEPVDTAFFDPSLHTPLPLPPLDASASTPAARPFRFLSMFKWEARKGWDVLLAAYFAEFSPSEPVELLLKTTPFHSPSNFDQLIAEWAAARRLPASRPAVRVLGAPLPLRELPRLYAAADAFVLPSRGEGWGRPHAEAMAMGLPVVATNWSGPTAFLDEEVGFPLRYALAPLPDEMRLPSHSWAEPSVAHLRQLMRAIFSAPAEARRRGAAARERMVARFSPEALAREVEGELRRIDAVLRAREGATGRGATMRDELR
ncbi:hypothetical protein AB1Y20_016657 [Prymnesium parvum]|uniref:Uncharacterized protein n=1 Tax=Prymnesium parvum TaxID=97485 RepID=A0AB34IAH2_PRYPA